VKLTVIGSSPAWPNPGSAHAGNLLESGGRSLLLDCGPGVLGRLREHEAWPSIDAIAITHFHLDHFGDLVPWVWGSWHRNGMGDRRPELWVYRGGHEHLTRVGAIVGFPDMFDKPFDVKEYDAGMPFTAAGFELTATRLPHYTLETYGFRVTDGVSTLAYSGDTGPSPALAEVARDADLFVCEATLRRGEDDGQPRGHLSIDEALEAHAAAGAHRLLLTHRPSELPVPDGLELAYDGLEIDL
jgi:ribonuclease BN (tRNA processing enzyme)